MLRLLRLGKKFGIRIKKGLQSSNSQIFNRHVSCGCMTYDTALNFCEIDYTFHKTLSCQTRMVIWPKFCINAKLMTGISNVIANKRNQTIVKKSTGLQWKLINASNTLSVTC